MYATVTTDRRGGGQELTGRPRRRDGWRHVVEESTTVIPGQEHDRLRPEIGVGGKGLERLADRKLSPDQWRRRALRLQKWCEHPGHRGQGPCGAVGDEVRRV